MRAWLAQKGVRRTEPEFELRDALSQPGCAVCRLTLRTAARQLDILSYEAVLDLDVRARLRASRGFCNRHAWQLLEETRDSLGTALIYRDVLDTLARVLEAPGRLGWRLVARRVVPRLVGKELTGDANLTARLAPSGRCPICEAQLETEEIYLRLFAERLPQDAFLAAWAASDGLCWPHLLRAIARATTEPALAALVARPPPPAGLAPEAGPSPSALARQLAGEFGHLHADRLALPAELVVDVRRRRLEDVARPGPADGPTCPACRATERVLPAGDAALPSPEHLGRVCGRHAWRLLGERGAGLAGPIGELHDRRRQALVMELDRAQAGASRRLGLGRQTLAGRVGRSAARALFEPALCPLCAAQAEEDRRAVATTLSAAETLVTNASGSLCLPHLLLACAGPASELDRKALLSRQSAAWRELASELAEYARKHDYRFDREPRGAEQSSPWRAVEQVAGPRGSRQT